jgi:hypothetical protein
MEEKSYTNCHGPTFSCMYPLTRRHFGLVLDALRQIFGEGHAFELDRVIEGGIAWTQWPGKRAHMTKSFRLLDLDHNTVRWPWLDEDVHAEEEAWKQSDSCVVSGETFGSVLKAFGGAPCWNIRQVQQWTAAFEVVGCAVCRKSLYPLSKYVSYDGKQSRTTPVKKRKRFQVRLF